MAQRNLGHSRHTTPSSGHTTESIRTKRGGATTGNTGARTAAAAYTLLRLSILSSGNQLPAEGRDLGYSFMLTRTSISLSRTLCAIYTTSFESYIPVPAEPRSLPRTHRPTFAPSHGTTPHSRHTLNCSHLPALRAPPNRARVSRPICGGLRASATPPPNFSTDAATAGAPAVTHGRTLHTSPAQRTRSAAKGAAAGADDSRTPVATLTPFSATALRPFHSHDPARTYSCRPRTEPGLLAGRGEIAIHILRTAQELEWSAVAVYTTEETSNATVADETVKLDGPPWFRESRVHCLYSKEIHPGYASRSPQPLLPTPGRPNDAFLGLAPETLRIAGDKRLQSTADLHAFGESGIGYPVMIKALDGGGGRGIRVVSAHEVVEEALKRCTGETWSG
ncbi:hypothetical protein FIBSPDRAFT_951342 [Athelia psychrophila]|uniref:ATP-grasp domain-containing protein n=1 Tax=Athelia psychrophila TaxID=1759441 RepID=A0A166MTI0_9AGAM|nr:hypothetical protein FIBSPDRAFT_951342 [Fibularhizoctonia sp. CBS 109695]